MKIAIGGDHAGYSLKIILLEYLRSRGHEVTDCGSYSPDPVDFPDITQGVCAEILENRCERGLLVCGTGVGACIAANKVKRIRAAVCHDIYSAHQCVEHDDVNVVCFGAQIIGSTVAQELVEQFLSARHSTSEEFRRRVEKLRLMEES